MLTQALEAEIEAFVDRHRHVVDEEGRRQVVRNGHSPTREVLTGAGQLEVQQPRARDRRTVDTEDKIRFSSSILPPYLRRSKSIDELIPWLYLRGISSGNFTEALQALAGPDAKALSANVVTRLTETWKQEYEIWNGTQEASGFSRASGVRLLENAYGFFLSGHSGLHSTHRKLVKNRHMCRKT